jgi:hypothetical protein
MTQKLLLFLTAGLVTALFILISCTQPAIPEPTTTPAIAPTALPTTAPDPTPTPAPTVQEQANQLLLNDGRFTTLLDDLTQEIGRNLSDAEQAQVLALARALWLPSQLDESDWLPDPAGMTLHWRPALNGREGPVLRVVEAQPDSPYAAGALIFWQGERLLSLTPGGVGYFFEFGRIHQNGWDFDTWIEYDAEGNIASFVHPDTMQYVTPESEDWTIFTLSDLDDQGNRVNSGLYWQNSGTPTEITTGPGNVPIADYLAGNPDLQLTQTEQNGQRLVALIDAQTGSLRYTLTVGPDGETVEWEQAIEVEFVAGWGVANGQVYREGDNGPHEDMNEAMSRGGLEPLSVWQDQDTETTYFKVNYEGRELDAELKDRHAGIGRAIIVRDVFVSEPNLDMPPAHNLRFWNQELAPGIYIAVIDNPQFVNIASDWVVFVNPPVDVSRSGYWQARGLFRGYTGGQLVYFTAYFRSTFTTSSGYWFDLSNLERDLGEGHKLESGDIWRNIKVNYPTGSGRSHSSLNALLNSGRYSSGEGKFMIGRFRPIQDENNTYVNDGTYQSVIQAVISGEINEDVFTIPSPKMA